MTDTGIVTPEAVVLAFDTAGVGSRIVATLLDLLVQAAAALIVVLAFTVVGSTPLGAAPALLGVFAIQFGYPLAMETLWRGRTLGMAAMGLRVVTTEGAPVRFRHALVRTAVGLVDFWITSGACAILFVLLTRRNQRLGDLAAGTLVLRERTGALQPRAATFGIPPGWEAYARSLDVSGLSGADYQAVRAYLLRAPTLDPTTRHRLAQEIATPLLPRLRHQPPPGVSAEGFLMCVAALFQGRQRAASDARGWDGAQAPGAQWGAGSSASPAVGSVAQGPRSGEPTWQGDVTPAHPSGQPAPGTVPPTEGFIAPG